MLYDLVADAAMMPCRPTTSHGGRGETSDHIVARRKRRLHEEPAGEDPEPASVLCWLVDGPLDRSDRGLLAVGKRVDHPAERIDLEDPHELRDPQLVEKPDLGSRDDGELVTDLTLSILKAAVQLLRNLVVKQDVIYPTDRRLHLR